jgi:hypothetical protein
MGDSIAYDPIMGVPIGILPLLTDRIGNAGTGGHDGFGVENSMTLSAGASTVATNWFVPYSRVPATETVEWSIQFQSRRWCDTAKVAWRAPVGGTATFKIQTCTDADGAGMGTWVDQGGVRTAVASGAEEEVGHDTITLTEGLYRLRVLGVSGTVDVFNMELSSSTMGGVVQNYQVQGGYSLSDWGNLSDTQRETFMDAIDPDAIIIAYKDAPATVPGSLASLLQTIGASLSGGLYQRNVVILAPYPTIPVGSPGWDEVYGSREIFRNWATVNRQTYIDWLDLGPIEQVYLPDNVHLSGAAIIAHMSQIALRRLGWIEYPTVQALTNPVVRRARQLTDEVIADSTTYVEYEDFRIPLHAGTFTIRGRFAFTSGATGTGAKVQLSHSGSGCSMDYVQYSKDIVNASPIKTMSPYFGGSYSWPLEMTGMTAYDTAFGYSLEQCDIITFVPGFLIVKIAKEVTGTDVTLRKGSFIEIETRTE